MALVVYTGEHRRGGWYRRWSWLYVVLGVVVGACSNTEESSTVAPASSDASATTRAMEGTTAGTVATLPDLDACVLVDARDAASVLGSPAIVDTPPAGGFGEASSCVRITESEASLVVSVFEGREFYGGDGLPGTEVLEVGDQGYIAVEPTFGGVNLQVVKGEWVLSLSTVPFGVVDIEGLPAAMTIVAQRAADRLP